MTPVKRIAGLILLGIGMAGVLPAPVAVPEIDPGNIGTAVALLSGLVVLVRSRRSRQ